MNFHQQTASGYPQPHRLFSYFPRRSRSKRLSDAAVARGRTAGLPPLIIAEMAMAACSGDFWHINQFKLFAESLIKRGPTVARSWYAGIAEAAADDLDGALVDIAARMGRGNSYAAQYKRRLLDQGIIEEGYDKSLSFGLPGMREFVAAR